MMMLVELKQRADLNFCKEAVDCTPGRHGSESTSSSKGCLFVFFHQKGEGFDHTRTDGNHHARAANLIIVL